MIKKRLANNIVIMKSDDGRAIIEMEESARKVINIETFERDMRRIFANRAKTDRLLKGICDMLCMASLLLGIISFITSYRLSFQSLIASLIFYFASSGLAISTADKKYFRTQFAISAAAFVVGCMVLSKAPASIRALYLYIPPAMAITSAFLGQQFINMSRGYKKTAKMFKELSTLRYEIHLRKDINE